VTITNNGLGPDGKAVVVDLTDGRYEGEQFARAATDTAQVYAVPGRVEQPVAYDAVILAGFGGPEGQDDVIPFLRNVTRAAASLTSVSKRSPTTTGTSGE